MLDKVNKMLDLVKWRLRNTKKYRKISFVSGTLISQRIAIIKGGE
jgi:hypothetical protein